ncbi:hypothetical protein [Priestia megaterium]|uniref:hypothetical protein n=1 Tax=Priestia megaterium TaxID=1404 RepID=UPI001A93B2A1|nr:hypothetical protein [Priestia megaterium]QSX20014.1 hypothetical protein J0P05_22690 [Priestia megaterium]
MLKVGMPVDVFSQFMTGPGKIVHISNESYYPIQVEMENPDADGHKMCRFNHAEIKPQEEGAKQTADPKYLTVELIKVIHGHSSLKIGECFTAKPTKQNKGTHYYLYEDDKFRGCFPVSHFRTFSLSDVVRRTKRPKQADLNEVKEKVNELDKRAEKEIKQYDKPQLTLIENKPKAEKPQKKEKNHFRQMEQEGQTSIFDFI